MYLNNYLDNIFKKQIYMSVIAVFLCYIFLGIFLIDYYQSNFLLFLTNFINSITYLMALLIFINNKVNISNLIWTSFLYNFIYGIVYVYLIYDYSGLFFQFIPSDAPLYDRFGRIVAEKNILDGVRYLVETTKYGMDDMGMVYYVSFLYKIVQSPLIVKFANLFINSLCAYLIYNISRKIIVEKYAKFAALVFAISSYNIWFLLSGLKEPLMLLFILICFKYYIDFITKKKISYLLLSFLIALSMFLFRIPILLMLLLSITLSELFRLKISPYKIFLGALSLSIVSYYIYTNIDLLYFYASVSNWAFTGEAAWKEENASLFLVILSGIYGPFPTITPIEFHYYHDVSVYANGLIVKMFFSFYFICSFYFIFKNKTYTLYAPAIFCIIEILALIFIEQTFKLRFAFIHFPIVFILSVYGISCISKHINKYKILTKINLISNICILMLIFAWNFLRV